MSSKTTLLGQIDQLISKYGKENPELLQDLQSHRDAITNALSKKEIMEAAYKFANVAKIFYDLFLKE